MTSTAQTTRAPKGAARRTALLEALAASLADQPLHAVQIGDLSSRSGVARTGFYFYFSTKHEAVAALLRDRGRSLCAGGEVLMRGAADAATVEAAIGATVDAWREHHVLLAAMLDARDCDPATRATWSAWRSALAVEPTTEFVERCTVSAGVEPRLLAEILVGLNERSLESAVREPQGPTSDLADGLAHVWRAALQL